MATSTPTPRARAVAVLSAALLAGGCVASPGGTPSATGPDPVSPAATSEGSPTASAPARPVSTPSATSAPTTATATPSPTVVPTPSNAGACPTPAGTTVRRAPGEGRTVALTFDDGPGPQTLAVADALDRAGVHATFFATGAHAAGRTDVVRELARRGHLVAGHSYDHRYPKQVAGGWTPAYVGSEIRRTAQVLTDATGQPVCFMRPPGGFLDGVPDASRATGTTVVMWSVDSLDWKQPATTTPDATAAIVAQATTAQDQQHPIVLFHDAKASGEPDSVVSPNRSNTVAALPRVIAWYRDHGYRFVRLDGRV